MVPWSALLLPALVAAVLVFVASSLIHMVLRWHNSDYRQLPNEAEVAAALNRGAPAPGQYMFPHCAHGRDMQSPDVHKRFAEGPVGVLYLRPRGMPRMGGFLAKWFVYTFGVALCAGYVARIGCAPGADYLRVFQAVGAASFLAYAGGTPIASIWKGVPWIVALKEMVDSLVYAALTAGAFAWLWQR